MRYTNQSCFAHLHTSPYICSLSFCRQLYPSLVCWLAGTAWCPLSFVVVVCLKLHIFALALRMFLFAAAFHLHALLRLAIIEVQFM